MTKAKKSERKIYRTYTNIKEEYEIICPHCFTTLRGSVVNDIDVLMFRCFQCQKLIDLRPKEEKNA